MKNLLFLLAGIVATGCAALGVNGNVDQAEVYSAVIRQQVTVDDTFRGRLKPPLIYILSATQDHGREVQQRQSRSLAPRLREQIAASLNDLQARIVWVETRDAVPMEADSSVAGKGVIVTVGNIHPQPDGSLRVPSNIYIANMAAGWQTYVLEQRDGAWKVMGLAGPQAISQLSTDRRSYATQS